MSDPFYRSREWRELRAACLARQPHCATPGCLERAVVADHIIPRSRGGADALHNLRGLCLRCHNQRRQGGEPRAWTAASGQPMDPRHWWNQPGAGNLSGLGAGTVWGEPPAVSSDPDPSGEGG
ncbi:HNH endonuclease [Roseococcus sp. DSY-14]|uniref:HNH endonuclease n=1 Tax=Roseococcus sp. DSY-14 TaxID=3369650 RepID=UPI00387B0077